MRVVLRPSIVLLAALALVLVGAGVFMARLDRASAVGGGPEMRLTANGCTADCTFANGEKFTLAVEVVEGPAGGYASARTFIDYGPDLTYDSSVLSVGDEILWPDCEPLIALRAETGPTFVLHGCLTGLLPPLPVSSFIGNIVEISVTCSAASSTTEIRLLPLDDPDAGTNGAAFVGADGINQVVPKVSNLLINCGAGAPVDTLTPTPTPTPTTIVDEPTTVVRVSPATQTVPAGTNVLVDIAVENAPSFSTYEFHLSFDPTVLEFLSVTAAETFLESTGRTANCFGPEPEDLTDGIISFACASLGAMPGPTGNGVLATLVFATSCSGSSALEFARLLANGAFVDAVSLSDELATALPVTTVGGEINVQSCSPSPTLPPTASPPPTLMSTATDTPVPPTATPGLSCHPFENCDAKIGIESLSLAVGESGSVDVTAFMSPAASTWVVDVIYDRDIITFTDCEAFNFAVCNHRFAPNAGTIAGASLQGISGSVRLGFFRVECLAPGTSNLDVVLTLLADTTIGAPQPIRAMVLDGKVSCEVPAVAVDFLAASLGAERTADIRATGIPSPGLAAWIIHLQYDPSLITPTNCVPTSNGVCNTDFSALAIRVNGAASSGRTGDFLIASITFACKRLGVGTLELTLEQFADATVGDPQRIDADTHDASVSCSDVVTGDANCNGTVDPIDATLILQFSSGVLGTLPCGDRADANGDGLANPLDAALILQFNAGLISSLPP